MSAYPKVAADPSMYCPNVRIMPCGPGPYLMMFVAPKMKPIHSPTAAIHQSLLFHAFARRVDVLPPIMAPILAVICVSLLFAENNALLNTFVKGRWTRHPSGSSYWRHLERRIGDKDTGGRIRSTASSPTARQEVRSGRRSTARHVTLTNWREEDDSASLSQKHLTRPARGKQPVGDDNDSSSSKCDSRRAFWFVVLPPLRRHGRNTDSLSLFLLSDASDKTTTPPPHLTPPDSPPASATVRTSSPPSSAEYLIRCRRRRPP